MAPNGAWSVWLAQNSYTINSCHSCRPIGTDRTPVRIPAYRRKGLVACRSDADARLPAVHPRSNRVFNLSVRRQRIAGLEANLESDIAVNSVIGKMDTRRTNASVTIHPVALMLFFRIPFGGRSEHVLGTSGLLAFEPQLLSNRLPVNVHVLRADLIALNLSEGSPREG
jgi:hypothetical protein